MEEYFPIGKKYKKFRASKNIWIGTKIMKKELFEFKKVKKCLHKLKFGDKCIKNFLWTKVFKTKK